MWDKKNSFGEGRDAPNGDFVASFTLKPEYSLLALRFICILFNRSRENLNNREGQSDSLPVDKYYVSMTTKGIRCNSSIIEGFHRGPYI